MPKVLSEADAPLNTADLMAKHEKYRLPKPAAGIEQEARMAMTTTVQDELDLLSIRFSEKARAVSAMRSGREIATSSPSPSRISSETRKARTRGSESSMAR